MKLSIVMMVKNEEKYLDKTLSSLKPIREKIDSELIILDTGSTDKTVEIAKKYTDKIYFDKWNNNFADMRNKSIGYASGEWLLILDADEPIIEFDKLIDFFQSDKHKKYNCGTIQLINIMSLEPIRNVRGNVTRFFRNIKGFKYTGIIHEQPQIIEPIYNNIITCEHYGYLFQDRKLQDRKLKRNAELLEKQLETEPKNKYYIHCHLSSTYLQMGRFADALNHGKMAYEIIKKLSTQTHKDKCYAFQYQNYIDLLIHNSEFKKAHKICLEYMKFDDKNIDILFYLSKTSVLLDRPQDCIKYSKKYLYYIENYDKSSSYNSLYIKCETLDNKEEIYNYLVISYLKLEDYDNIVNIFENYDFNKSEIYPQLVLSLYKLGKLDKLIDIYINLQSNAERKKLRLAIEANLRTKVEKEDLFNFYTKFSTINDEYGIFNKYRLDKNYSDDIENIILNRNDLFYYEIVDIFLENKGILPEILKYIHNEKLESIFVYCISNNREFKFRLEKYILSVNNTLDMNIIKVHMISTKVLLFNGELLNKEYGEIFQLYAMYSNYYYRFTNKNTIINKDVFEIKSFEEMFINELNKLFLIEDKVDHVKKLKTLALDYPNHKRSVEYLIENFERDTDTSEEINNLKDNFIQMVSNNISIDNIENIKILLKEYEDLYGIDYKILNIYGIIDIYKHDLKSAEINFKNALSLNIYNTDTIYNIAYLKEIKQEFVESILFYEFCKKNTNEKDLINICNERINELSLKI